ncbi:MAG: peptide chain release factor N(5)-glutamine methyltransferase [Clostridiales bacterium]
MPEIDNAEVSGREAYARACRQLKKAGFSEEAACREAKELLAFCWKKDGLQLLLDFDAPLETETGQAYEAAVERLANHEPMAYLTGCQDFGGLDCHVVPGVLIPRRDTLVLVNAALARLPEEESVRVLELGSGSGAVITSLALARPLLQGVAVDINPLAVETTRKNLRLNQLEQRVQVREGSWFEPLGPQEQFRLILSNPPYISTEEMTELPENVRKEPVKALWGGKDGLDCYREILPAAYGRLEDKGWCLVETGWRQGPAVKALFAAAGFRDVEILQDEGGRDRVVLGCRRNQAGGSNDAEALSAAAAGSSEAAAGLPDAEAAAGTKGSACKNSKKIKKTQYWRIKDGNDPRIKEAARILREGGLVAFPTETVYGLGAYGLDEKAVARIYEAKGRPSDNPLILHVASLAEAKELTKGWPEKAQRAANKLWPGPLTIVVPAAEHIPPIVTAGLDTVAIRFPAEPIAQALIEACGGPIAAPSANTSGRPSPTKACHVLEDLDGKIEVIIDGGPCQVGLESTILDLSVEPPAVLRPGDITLAALNRILGPVQGSGEEQAGAQGAGHSPHGSHSSDSSPPKAPGMKYRHYAPQAPATILQGNPHAVTAFVARLMLQPSTLKGPEDKREDSSHGPLQPEAGGERPKIGLLLSEETWRLLLGRALQPEKDEELYYCRKMGSHSRPREMGALLYDALRACDQEGVGRIFVEACSAKGRGAAVMNRLLKAAGNRIWRLDKEGLPF